MATGHMTEQILQLTLEILCLLTGEDYEVVNKSTKCTTNNSPSCYPGRAPKLNDDKILQVTKKIIELLTGEVPIRCQDVAVYLSMEEREYLEKHRNFYKEAMREDQPSLKTKGTPEAPGTSMDLKIPMAVSHESPNLGVCKSKANGKWKVAKSPNVHQVGSRRVACTKSTQTELDFNQEGCTQSSPLQGDSGVIYSIAEDSVTTFTLELPQPSAGPDCAENHVYQLPEQTQNTKIEHDTEANVDTRSGDQPSTWQQNYDRSHEDTSYPLRTEDGAAPAETYASYGREEPYKSAQTNQEPKAIMFTNLYAPVDLTQEELSNIKQELVTWEEESRSFQEIYLPVTHVEDSTAHPKGGGLAYCNTHIKLEHEENRNSYGAQEQEQVDFMVIPLDDDGEGAIDPENLNSQAVLNYVGRDENFNSGFGYGMPQMFNCPDCNRSFSGATALAKHQLICRGRKPHVCTGCGKRFASASYLVIHERIHTGERPFSCSHCGKSFSRKPDLVRHERIHTGERPFACPDCGKRFTSVSNIFMHRRIHTGVKPFPCTQCGKRFIKKSDLVRHERIHLPQRPLPCPECGKFFSSNYVLNKHMLSHAGDLHLTVQGCS